MMLGCMRWCRRPAAASRLCAFGPLSHDNWPAACRAPAARMGAQCMHACTDISRTRTMLSCHYRQPVRTTPTAPSSRRLHSRLQPLPRPPPTLPPAEWQPCSGGTRSPTWDRAPMHLLRMSHVSLLARTRRPRRMLRPGTTRPGAQPSSPTRGGQAATATACWCST